jgi:hypothetical protein
VFPNIPSQIVAPGQTVTLVIRASDADGQPPQILTYSILSGPTNGTLLLNQGGQIRWIIPTNQPTGDYPIQLQVTDNGVPPRSDTFGFTFFVRTQTIITADVPPSFYAVFAPPGQVTFSIETTPGRAYRVLYTDDLAGGTWVPFGRDFVAANPYASLTDSLALPQRYYQVMLLP